jgi:glucokinase
MILAGDVGGTKVHLALYGFEHGRLVHVRDERFPAHEFTGLEEIVRRFLNQSGSPEITAACFGVPGPVRGGRLKLTNLPWVIDSRELSSNLRITHLFLINDLEANGYGIPELTPDQIFTLNQGDAAVVGHRALVSAGTGLGEGVLVWNGKSHVPMASEGGHCDFAARTPLEIELLAWLMKKLDGRVSFERVVSGPGLSHLCVPAR